MAAEGGPQKARIDLVNARRLPLLLALGACLCACGPVHEQEPNDDYTHATPLPAGRTAQGTLGSAADVDWYRVQASRDGILSVRLSGIRETDWVLSVRGPDRTELKRIDETGIGGDEQALDLFVGPAGLYLVVSNKNAKANNPSQPYRMKTTFESPVGREREPNDGALSATVLEPNAPMRGHYFPSTNLLAEDGQEEDWFKISVAKPGLQVLNIDVSEVPKVDAVLEVYDANSYKVREADAGGAGEAETIRNFGVRGPAEYKLRLRAKGRAANPDVFYQLVTELVPYQGNVEFEPNDQRLDATPMEGDSISGTIAPTGDVDWYRLAADTGTKQILSAELSAVPGMDLQLAVMDEVGNPMLLIDNMGKEQPEVLTGIGARAVQYLVVSEKTGKKADARQGYTLTRRLTPWQPGLEYELNDSSRTAQAVKVGEAVDGWFAPKGDVDWYEFNVYQKGTAALELSGVLNVRATMTLYDQDYRELKSATAVKPGDSISMEVPLEAGTYAVRLSPVDPGQCNTRDKYTFRVGMK